MGSKSKGSSFVPPPKGSKEGVQGVQGVQGIHDTND